MKEFTIVYQCGMANVFDTTGGHADHRKRVLQGTFRDCEQFMRGARAAGAEVRIRHADVAGDCTLAFWEAGAGDMFGESKCYA